MSFILIKYRERNDLIRVLGDVNDTHSSGSNNTSSKSNNKYKERPHDTYSPYRDESGHIYSASL